MSDYRPDEAPARQDLCRFLSACFYEPAPEFAEERLMESIVIAAERLDPPLAAGAQRMREAFEAQDLQTLLVDYTRLFIGPIDTLAKPYAAAWLPAGAPAEDNPPPAVLDFYAEGGFEMDESFQELPDHVAVELEFLYLLNFKRHQAKLAGEPDAAASAESLHRRFVDEHLGAWIGPFAAAIRSGAETSFYRELATLTEQVVGLQTTPASVH